MKKKRWIITFALPALIALVVVVVNLPPKEPVYQGRPVGSWIHDFESQNDAKAAKAIQAIHALGSNAVPPLISSLHANDSILRRAYAGVILKLPAQWQSALPETRLNAWMMRARCASCLGDLGPAAAPAIPALVLALGDAAQAVRFSAAGALGKISTDVPRVVPALMNAVTRDPDREVRLQAVEALGRIGPRARCALPLLLGLLKSTNHLALTDMVERRASEAIWRIDPTQTAGVVPVLIAQMKRNDEAFDTITNRLTQLKLRQEAGDNAETAAQLLGDMGAEAQTAASALEKMLDQGNNRILAAKALWRITGQADKSLPTLLELVLRPDACGAWSAEVLGQMGPVARKAAPVLAAVLATNDLRWPRYEQAVAQALKQIDPEAAAKAGVK